MKTIPYLVAVAALGASLTALADPTNVPMEQGFESVNRNIAKNPDNQGLQNANSRLIENQIRQADRGRNHAPGQQRTEGVEGIERIERVERPQRPERIERVDLPTRAEIARAQRPERPERGLAKGHK